jgi:hypothetical protein
MSVAIDGRISAGSGSLSMSSWVSLIGDSSKKFALARAVEFCAAMIAFEVRLLGCMAAPFFDLHLL